MAFPEKWKAFRKHEGNVPEEACFRDEYRIMMEQVEKQQTGMCLDSGGCSRWMEREGLIPQGRKLLSSGSAEISRWPEAGIERKHCES